MVKEALLLELSVNHRCEKQTNMKKAIGGFQLVFITLIHKINQALPCLEIRFS